MSSPNINDGTGSVPSSGEPSGAGDKALTPPTPSPKNVNIHDTVQIEWRAPPESVFKDERCDLNGIAPGPLGNTDFYLTERSAAFPLDPSGRYVLCEELARGGVGIIYRGRDTGLGREVAIKVLNEAHRDKIEVKRRFSAEARITARLQHPGIVPIYAIGHTADARPFFSMDLLAGRTLASLLAGRRRGNGDYAHFLHVFEYVCQAVAYAHSHGVIHRDLKPSNIMVADFGIVKVMDWGVAKVLRVKADVSPPGALILDPRPNGASAQPCGHITHIGSVMGTPAYMAPEQAVGNSDQISMSTDVFGLGAILCEILTGDPPYRGHSDKSVHHQASSADLSDAFARLDSCGAEAELLAMAKSCLQPKPECRFKDAAELAQILTAYRESQLRRAERDLVRFFELSMDLFCIAGLNGYFLRVNSNFSRVLGYSSAELLAHPFIHFVHLDDHAVTLAEMEKLNHGLPVVQFRNRYRDISGNYRWFEWVAKSIVEEKIVFAVARDVTERMELENRVSSMTSAADPNGTAA